MLGDGFSLLLNPAIIAQIQYDDLQEFAGGKGKRAEAAAEALWKLENSDIVRKNKGKINFYNRDIQDKIYNLWRDVLGVEEEPQQQ